MVSQKKIDENFCDVFRGFQGVRNRLLLVLNYLVITTFFVCFDLNLKILSRNQRNKENFVKDFVDS